jgi:hypothetical protein
MDCTSADIDSLKDLKKLSSLSIGVLAAVFDSNDLQVTFNHVVNFNGDEQTGNAGRAPLSLVSLHMNMLGEQQEHEGLQQGW